jgi:tRNA pseudouridine55 synthase
MSTEVEFISLYKDIGETPLECIERFRAANPSYKEVKMTYLGRLDPMAEGLLLVLAGNTKTKDDFLGLDKTYEFEVLWGVETDTYDVLGLISNISHGVNVTWAEINSSLKKIKDKKTQEYPPYSSKPVQGKPLFMWAREQKIEEIDVPTRGIKIFNVEHIHTRDITGEEMLREILEKINKVQGDFRQKEIIKSWEKSVDRESRYMVSKFVADVSSGTYIRGLAHDMGKLLGTNAIAYSIKRTRVGEYKLD